METKGRHVRVTYVIARLERAVRRRIAADVAPHGLTVPQYTALSILRDRAGLSNAQLARRSYVTPQSMGEVIRALEEMGLIEREADPGRTRTLRTLVTSEGQRILSLCDAAVASIEKEMFAGVPARRRDEMIVALTDAVHALGAGHVDL